MEPYLISKSHAEKRWWCARAEYFAYIFGNTGLQPVTPAFDLLFGIILHDALGQIARTVGLPGDIIATIAPNVRQRVEKLCAACQMETEAIKQWGSIGEGLIRAFYQRRWPVILRQYEIIHVEVACVKALGEDLWFVARPDLVLRDRLTKGYWYWEYKTTGWTDARWIKSWQKAIQVHSGILAAQETLGITFDGCYVEGLFKGKKDAYNNIQSSPFAYGWVNRGVPGVLNDQYSYGDRTASGGYGAKRGKDWQRFPTYTLVDGLGPWVFEMPEDLIDAQFVRTPPIGLRDDLAEDFFDQQRYRIREVREATEKLAKVQQEVGAGTVTVTEAQASIRALLNRYFPQDFSHCEPAFGHGCEFNDICWQSAVAKNPLASGLYTRRKIEHQQEFIKLLPMAPQSGAEGKPA